METIIIIGAVLIILGIIGSIIPALPGPVLSFLGILFLFIEKGPGAVPFSTLLIFGIITIFLILLDYVAPIYGARQFGASKKGTWGAVVGALVGIIFFPPLGIFLGALMGAILGEIYGGKRFEQSLKAGLGVIAGSVTMLVLQMVFSLIAAAYFFAKITI